MDHRIPPPNLEEKGAQTARNGGSKPLPPSENSQFFNRLLGGWTGKGLTITIRFYGVPGMLS